MEETTKAYLAGLIDGEGGINITGSYIPRLKRKHIMLGVKVAMRTWTCIEFFAKAVNSNVSDYGIAKYGGVYECVIWQNKARLLLVDILPYLVGKVEQAKLGILFYEICFSKRSRGANKLSPMELQIREAFSEIMKLLHKIDSFAFYGKADEFEEQLRVKYLTLSHMLTPSQASMGKGIEEGVTTTTVSPNNNLSQERPPLIH